MGNDPNEQGYQQPSLGIVIGWNRPQARWWQPFIMLDLGFWHMQLGWLYD